MAKVTSLKVEKTKFPAKSKELEPAPDHEGWGVTDGKKWFWWAYTTKEAAEKVMAGLAEPKYRNVNVIHPRPFELSDKKADEIKSRED